MSSTKQQIVLLAEELIRRKGFNAFSYADIAALLNVRNAAIHYHFPSKTDLGIAVIDTELERMADSRQRHQDQPGDFLLKLLFSDFDQSRHHRLICLMGSLSPDFDTFDQRMQGKVSEMSAMILSDLAEVLERGRKEGRMKFAGSAMTRASIVVSVLMSSLILARVRADSEAFRITLDLLLQDLGTDWKMADLENFRQQLTESGIPPGGFQTSAGHSDRGPGCDIAKTLINP